MPDTILLQAPTYDEDFYAWALDQSNRLRALADARANVPLDLANLADEVDGLAKYVRNLYRSEIRRIIEHLLKLEFSPASSPQAGWQVSIMSARQELADNLTPTLRREVQGDLDKLYRDARKRAASSMADEGKEAAAKSLPLSCPYGFGQIVDEDWFPTR
jgi:hypothetical protein